MKKMFYTGICVPFPKIFSSLLLFGFCTSATKAQSFFFSGFDIPAGKFEVSKPSCTLGLGALSVPSITNAANIASGDLSDYATLTSSGISVTALCIGEYQIATNLNIGSLSTIPATPTNPFNVGFKVSVSEAVRAGLVSNSSSLSIVTYEGTVQKERSTVGPVALGLLQAGVPQFVSFLATESFNRVAVEVSSGLLTLASGSTMDFYYGFATSDLIILPVKLTDFSATMENKTVALNWASTMETNLARYELQRSSDGGATYTTITTVKAKGNTATETRYSFVDGTVAGGSYVYRLNMVDKDGKAEYSKMVWIKLAAGANWKIYPTLLSSGTNLNINLTATGGKTAVQLTNMQGQTLRTASTITDNKLTIATGNLSAGIYVLKLYKDGQLQASEKIVIQ